MRKRLCQLATLCYIKHKGKTLMLHRVKKINDVHKDKWNGLGGKFFPGETPEECIVREVKEESGLAIKHPTLRGVLTFPQFTPYTDWVVFLFTATQFSGKLKDSNEGHLEWIANNKIKTLPLWKGDYLFLNWLDKKKFFSAKFIYKKKRLMKYNVTFYLSKSFK